MAHTFDKWEGTQAAHKDEDLSPHCSALGPVSVMAGFWLACFTLCFLLSVWDRNWDSELRVILHGWQ